MTQTRYTPLTPSTAGAPEKALIRNLVTYPDTVQGQAALASAVAAGTVTIIDAVPAAQRLGTIPAAVNETRQDSGGRTWNAQKALAQSKNVLTYPPKYGISYPLTEQTAQGVVNWDRWEEIPLLSDRKVILFGPWFNQDPLNRHFLHGVNAVNMWPNFRSGVTNMNNLSVDKKFFMWDDANCRAYTQGLLNDPANTSSPYRAIWSAFANSQQYSTGTNVAAAFAAIGARMWNDVKNSFAIDGHGIRYTSYDLESTSVGDISYNYQRECIGAMYDGFCAAAAAAGETVVPVIYGQNTFDPNIFDNSLRQVATGYPEYLNGAGTSSPKDLYPAIDNTLKAINDYHGVLVDDGYFQRIWGQNDNIMLRNPDNSLILSGGVPQYNTSITSTTAYGQTIPLENSEVTNFVLNYYRHFGRKFQNRYWAANGYPATDNTRRAGMENVLHGAYTRITNEAVLGMTYNDRPLPAWLLKSIKMGNLFECDYAVQWGDDYNIPPAGQGAASTKWTYNAAGTTEAMLDAIHDYAYYDAKHNPSANTSSPKRAWWNLDVVSSNNIDGEFPWQKPIVKTRIRKVGGKQYIEVFATWPLLDKTSLDLKLWFIKNGKTSSAYTLTIPSGREYHYSMFEVPADTEFLDLDGADLRLRFTDLLGVTRTWRGDYRTFTTADASVATPPDFVIPVLGGGSSSSSSSSSSAGPALTFGTVTYDGVNNKLKIPVNNLVGNVTWIVSGVGVFTDQPTAGFTLTGNAINTLVSYRVHTDTQAEISGQLQCDASTGSSSSSSTPGSSSSAAPGTSWFAGHVGIGPNVYISLEGDQNNLNDRYRVMTTAKNGGCNFVSLVVSFSSMQYQNWDTLNTAGNLAKTLGMKIRLVYDLAPTADWIGHAATAYLPAVPSGLVRQCKQDGSTFVGNGNTVSFSMYDPSAIQFYVDTATLWTNYIKTQGWSSEVVAVEAGCGSTVELQYDFATYVNGSTVPILSGYESVALAAFRIQLQNKFTTIGAMNSALGTSFASFAAIGFPAPSGAMSTAFQGVFGSYFMLHRVYGLKRFIDNVYGVFQSLAPTWTRICDSGSYDDNLSLQRGTTNPVLLTGSIIQMRKTNGQLGFNHERNIDECCAGGLYGANEIDYASDTGSTNQSVQGKFDQIVRSVYRGARLVTLNCYGISDANLNALTSQTTDLAGNTRPNVGAMCTAGPIAVSRTSVQNISFDQWTHMDADTGYTVGQQWQTVENGDVNSAVDIRYQTETLTA